MIARCLKNAFNGAGCNSLVTRPDFGSVYQQSKIPFPIRRIRIIPSEVVSHDRIGPNTSAEDFMYVQVAESNFLAVEPYGWYWWAFRRLHPWYMYAYKHNGFVQRELQGRWLSPDYPNSKWKICPNITVHLDFGGGKINFIYPSPKPEGTEISEQIFHWKFG